MQIFMIKEVIQNTKVTDVSHKTGAKCILSKVVEIFGMILSMMIHVECVEPETEKSRV